jgi:hypothetical protein
LSEASITLGITLTIGKVIVNPKEIRGVGGWHNPYLHIPIKTQLYPREKGEQIALIRLTASLHLTENQDITNQFGTKISYDFINNLPNRSSTSTTPSEGGAQLLFSLTHEQIKQLEDLRHKPNSNLYLYLEPVIARMKHTDGANLTFGDYQEGVLQVDFSYLWVAAIGTLRLETAEMKWAENIFPGIGYDRFRLIEITLPSSSKLVPNNAIELFDKARGDYDTANYNGCVEKCRFVIEAIERHLSVPAHTHKLGDAVAGALGWSVDLDQCKFLNLACQAHFKLTSVAHHYPSTISLLPADAQIALHSIATLLEYLGQLR